MSETNYAARLREAEQGLKDATTNGDQELHKKLEAEGKALLREICGKAGIKQSDFENACCIEKELTREMREAFSRAMVAAAEVGWDEYLDVGFQFLRLLHTVYATMYRFNETAGVKFFKILPMVHAGNNPDAVESIIEALRDLCKEGKENGAKKRASSLGSGLDALAGAHGVYKGELSPTLVAQYEVHGTDLARCLSVFGLTGTATDNADLMESTSKLITGLLERDQAAKAFHAIYVKDKDYGIFTADKVEALRGMADTAKLQADTYRATQAA